MKKRIYVDVYIVPPGETRATEHYAAPLAVMLWCLETHTVDRYVAFSTLLLVLGDSLLWWLE